MKANQKPGVYMYKTIVGKCKAVDNPLYFLSENEKDEMDTIGYTGKNHAGKKISFENYLNSLNKGDFTVRQTKFDNGDFSEEYTIARKA